MHDPRTNKVPYNPVKETKDMIADCGYPFVIEGIWVTFALPGDKTLRITFKQALKRNQADLKALIEAAINQDEIKKNLPGPSIYREGDLD